MIKRTKESIFLEHKLYPYINARTHIKEGLIKTYPLQASLHILKKLGMNGMSEEDTFNRGYNLLDNHRIALSIKLDFHIQKDLQEFYIIFNTINVLQYFISTCLVGDDKLTNEQIKNLREFVKNRIGDHCIMMIEPKYDVEVDPAEFPKFMYYVTSDEGWKRIQKIGLSPKSGYKIAKHPDRIYLSSSIESSFKLIEINTILRTEPYTASKELNSLLKIDMNQVPSRNRFFIDTNAYHALYSYDYIPPIAITKQ